MDFFKRSVNGNIFRGKTRLVKPVSRKSVATLHREYELQERNMLYLRHPYLTREESSGHAKALGKPGEVRKKWAKEALSGTMRPHVTIEERLFHLDVKKSWE